MKEGIKIYYWNNGKVMYEIPYKNGLRHGLTKHWGSNGQPSTEIPLKNNLEFGAMIKFEYEKNGKRKT